MSVLPTESFFQVLEDLSINDAYNLSLTSRSYRNIVNMFYFDLLHVSYPSDFAQYDENINYINEFVVWFNNINRLEDYLKNSHIIIMKILNKQFFLVLTQLYPNQYVNFDENENYVQIFIEHVKDINEAWKIIKNAQGYVRDLINKYYHEKIVKSYIRYFDLVYILEEDYVFIYDMLTDMFKMGFVTSHYPELLKYKTEEIRETDPLKKYYDELYLFMMNTDKVVENSVVEIGNFLLEESEEGGFDYAIELLLYKHNDNFFRRNIVKIIQFLKTIRSDDPGLYNQAAERLLTSYDSEVRNRLLRNTLAEVKDFEKYEYDVNVYQNMKLDS